MACISTEVTLCIDKMRQDLRDGIEDDVKRRSEPDRVRH